MALGGRPGVHTARWAAGDPVGRMLDALAGQHDRRAGYVCVIVALAPDGREVVARALDGTIAGAAAGGEGFGFDPVFVPVGSAARWRSSGTTGSATTRTAPARRSSWHAAGCRRVTRARTRAGYAAVPDSGGASSSAAPGAGRFGSTGRPVIPYEDVVQCCAEHDHVRHHVEPDEQEERRSEGLERDLRREEHEQRQRLQRAHEHQCAEDRAREHLPTGEAGVRQPVERREEEREQGRPEVRSVNASATHRFETASVA